jgi:alcohol dehydrogenase (cytochrome c)
LKNAHRLSPLSPSAGIDESRNRAGSAVPSASAASPGTTPPPPFSRAQVTAGKVAYDASCAVCHGSTLMNGTFGTPLAGEYFRRQWSGRSVAELFEKSRTTMPPKATGSLPAETHAAIIAYVLEVNGSVPGAAELPADAARLAAWRVP